MTERVHTLKELRRAHELAREHLSGLIDHKFPGNTVWHWYRALHAVKGEPGRRNDDCTNDAVLAADVEIMAAHDEYIRLLHIFYRARDGEHGVLGAYK